MFPMPYGLCSSLSVAPTASFPPAPIWACSAEKELWEWLYRDDKGQNYRQSWDCLGGIIHNSRIQEGKHKHRQERAKPGAWGLRWWGPSQDSQAELSVSSSGTSLVLWGLWESCGGRPHPFLSNTRPGSSSSLVASFIGVMSKQVLSLTLSIPSYLHCVLACE